MPSILTVLIQSKLALGSAVLCMLFLVTDFNERFIVETDSKKLSLESINVTELPSVKLNDNVLTKTQTLLTPFITKEPDKLKEIEGMSLDEQAKQQGELTDLFINNNKLTLKAIIVDKSQRKNQLQALILVTDVKTNISKIEKFSHLNTVYGYNISIENNNQVTLSRAETAQEVILKMYSAKA